MQQSEHKIIIWWLQPTDNRITFGCCRKKQVNRSHNYYVLFICYRTKQLEEMEIIERLFNCISCIENWEVANTGKKIVFACWAWAKGVWTCAEKRPIFTHRFSRSYAAASPASKSIKSRVARPHAALKPHKHQHHRPQISARTGINRSIKTPITTNKYRTICD